METKENGRSLEELAREAQRAYNRQWRAKNRDKVRENNRRYWQRRALALACAREQEQ